MCTQIITKEALSNRSDSTTTIIPPPQKKNTLILPPSVSVSMFRVSVQAENIEDKISLNLGEERRFLIQS